MVRTYEQPSYKFWEKIVFFFPVQLFFVHLKKNLVLLAFWLLLFAIVTKTIAVKYGIPSLFLYPEYLGEVGFVSHLIIGLLTGAFIMAFNISSYVINGFRFPFLATLNRPFIKYCQNNFILPLTYALVYVVSLINFQWTQEQVSMMNVSINVIGFLSGNLFFIALTVLYFTATNKSLFHFNKEAGKPMQGRFINPVNDLFGSRKKWDRDKSKNNKEWRVTAYISHWGQIALARDSSHYDKETLEKVYSQNRVNASIFQIVILILIFCVGLFHEMPVFMIPAAGSVLLFFTMLIMIASAMSSWFKGWTPIVFLVLVVGLNFYSMEGPFSYDNQAYGLRYDTAQVAYTQDNIRKLQENNQNLYLDVENGLQLLQNWKARTGKEKPVAVFLNVPGGGLRSAMWTIRSISFANQENHGEVWKNLLMISGSSGGMIGAAYLREYFYRLENEKLDLSIDSILSDMGKDKLNTVASTAVLNDIFFRFKEFTYEGNTYTKDRALAFEQKLDRDTRGWMQKKVKDYFELEMSGKMPVLLLSPTISDDGRKLLISAQPVAYLCHNNDSNQMNDNIEFNRFFASQGAENLSFLTALRMSATFPYVFPAASLPTEPSIEILDAGIRDNYGITNTLKFVYFFREWLALNTSKVVIIQVRDQQKFTDLKPHKPSLLESITQPLGTFYSTILDVQDYLMDDQIRMAKTWYKGEIHTVDFVLDRSEKNPISLSWHLTEREKNRIYNAIESDYNTVELIRLKRALGTKKSSLRTAP